MRNTMILCLSLISSPMGLAQAKQRESILVVRVADQKPIYQSSPDLLLSPASVSKVISTAALLHYFGPAHTFKTRFYLSGLRQGEQMKGDLVVKGDGDPMIISEKLWQLAADFSHLGYKEFTGDLIIDNSLFDDEQRDESREEGTARSSHAYDAPVSAFGVNFNTLPIAIAPGFQATDKARISFDPYPIENLRLLNQTKTVSGSQTQIQASRDSQQNQSSWTVKGSIGTSAPLVKVYRSMGNPVRESAEQLRAFLAERGIQIRGRIREGKTPERAKLIYTLESYDLGFIVKGLNHFSNNYLADMLVKRLGAAFPTQGSADQAGSGTLSQGVAAIQRFLKNEVGIKSRFDLFNGSGLDHRNRLSAAQIVQVLLSMQTRMEVYPEFLASFPASGESGTLRKRFKGMDQDTMKGLVRAKTGTLSEPIAVSSLAGYMGHPTHGILAFAILNNGEDKGPQPSIAEFRVRQDRALTEIMEKY